jgi:hypothetical protein
VIFIDRGHRLEIPCKDSAEADDAWLLRYLGTCYMVLKAEGAIMAAFLPKELTRVDVVEVSIFSFFFSFLFCIYHFKIFICTRFTLILFSSWYLATQPDSNTQP